METESANNTEFETIRPRMNTWEARMVYSGIAIARASGCVFPGSDEALAEAEEVLGIGKDDDNNKPPKPPSRPNAKIGGLAFQGGL